MDDFVDEEVEETLMSISRRNFVIQGGASTSALAFLRAVPASAADSFRPELLPSVAESWQDVRLVNNEWDRPGSRARGSTKPMFSF